MESKEPPCQLGPKPSDIATLMTSIKEHPTPDWIKAKINASKLDADYLNYWPVFEDKYLILRDLKGTDWYSFASRIVKQTNFPVSNVILKTPVYRPKDDITVTQEIKCKVVLMESFIDVLKKYIKDVGARSKKNKNLLTTFENADNFLSFLENDYHQKQYIGEIE